MGMTEDQLRNLEQALVDQYNRTQDTYYSNSDMANEIAGAMLTALDNDHTPLAAILGCVLMLHQKGLDDMLLRVVQPAFVLMAPEDAKHFFYDEDGT